jgi:hypothetical protein
LIANSYSDLFPTVALTTIDKPLPYKEGLDILARCIQEDQIVYIYILKDGRLDHLASNVGGREKLRGMWLQREDDESLLAFAVPQSAKQKRFDLLKADKVIPVVLRGTKPRDRSIQIAKHRHVVINKTGAPRAPKISKSKDAGGPSSNTAQVDQYSEELVHPNVAFLDLHFEGLPAMPSDIHSQAEGSTPQVALDGISSGEQPHTSDENRTNNTSPGGDHQLSQQFTKIVPSCDNSSFDLDALLASASASLAADGLRAGDNTTATVTSALGAGSQIFPTGPVHQYPEDDDEFVDWLLAKLPQIEEHCSV